MGKILARFWLKRFSLVFAVASIGLAAVELIEKAGQGFSYRSVFGWSAVAAVFASSLATYWAYKRQCRLVFKTPIEDPTGDDAA